MAEILRDSVYYAAKTKLMELAVELAKVRNPLKLESQIIQGTKIHRLCQGLDYEDYLTQQQIDRIVRTLVEVAEINDFPVAPVLGNIDPLTISNQGARGERGEDGAAGPEGGGVPFSATNVSIDTVCDSFAITESRGVEYTMNIYDDSGADMRILRLQGGWSADGATYGDDGGIGQTITGDCSGISMSLLVVGTEVRLMATVTSGTWTIEGTRKYVPNNGNGIVNPTTLASGKIWVGNTSNSPTAVTPSGDVSISTAGVMAIGSGVIVNADISGTAAISASKLAAMSASKAVVTDANGFITTSATTATQVGYLSTVTSDVQVQLDSKIGSANGAISTVVSTNLTADRVVISNPSGKIAVSSVTSTELAVLDGITATTAELNKLDGVTVTTAELNYSSGLTGNIQTQIDALSTASAGLNTKIVEIGDWNMDSTAGLSVNHGITSGHSKIRSVSVVIRNDFDNAGYDLLNSGTVRWDTSTVTLNRTASGDFDSTSFDATAFNRGWLTIQYTS